MNSDCKTTVRFLIENAFNQGDLSVLSDLIHPNYQYTSTTDSMNGLDELDAFIRSLRFAFPDIHLRIDDQFSEDLKVCTRITMTGTHHGDFLGIPATGNSVELQAVVISELSGGLIIREWELLDQMALMQQLGLVPKEG